MKQKGQALVVLLVFTVVTLTLVTAAVAVTIINSQASTSAAEGEASRMLAESGIEEALIRLVRDPSYTGGTLTAGDGSATVTVAGTNPKTITSQARRGEVQRIYQVNVTMSDDTLTVTNWQEVY